MHEVVDEALLERGDPLAAERSRLPPGVMVGASRRPTPGFAQVAPQAFWTIAVIDGSHGGVSPVAARRAAASPRSRGAAIGSATCSGYSVVSTPVSRTTGSCA